MKSLNSIYTAPKAFRITCWSILKRKKPKYGNWLTANIEKWLIFMRKYTFDFDFSRLWKRKGR